MSLKKNITLEWGGKSYTTPVTMELIDKIDEDLNLYKLTMRMASGDVRFSHAAKLVYIILNEGGSKATHEEVYSAMFSDGLTSMTDVITRVGEILQAIYPQGDTKKKSVKKTSTKKKSTT